MAVKVEKTPVNAPEFQSAGPQANFKGTYPSKQKQFLSAVQTGTGAQQSIAHGLGAAPAGVLISCADNSGSSNVFTVAEGTHDGTNVKVTVTTGAKYKILAWL
jgi:hypothetical protein